jgi:hypothetical protein
MLVAIENDCEAIGRLLHIYGTSEHFGPQQRCQFEELLRHRRQLIAKLAALRTNNMVSGEWNRGNHGDPRRN